MVKTEIKLFQRKKTRLRIEKEKRDKQEMIDFEKFLEVDIKKFEKIILKTLPKGNGDKRIENLIQNRIKRVNREFIESLRLQKKEAQFTFLKN